MGEDIGRVYFAEGLCTHKCSNLHAAIGNQTPFGAVVHTGLSGGGSHPQVDDSGDLLQLSGNECITGIHNVHVHDENVL